MTIHRFGGYYTTRTMMAALMESNTFGIALDVDELCKHAGILPAFERELGVGYLYLIQSYHRGFPCLKIGKTLDLRRRMYEYDQQGELQMLVGAYLVCNMNLGELFIIRTFDQHFVAPRDFNNRRIGREYYLWSEYVQSSMLSHIHRMLQFVSDA